MNITNGVTFIPKFVRQNSDLNYGETVTHENYNEKLNLNTAQGDYNTELLRLLFTSTNPAEVPHVKYLDKIITDEVNRIDGTLAGYRDEIDECNRVVQETRNEMSSFTTQVNNIITGVTKVGHAVVADNLSGAASAGLHKYYGTDINGAVGFHEMPAALYARDMSSGAAEIEGIYFTPRGNSVTEDMLTETLRTKINRETISDYDLLMNRPRINNVLLTGNLTLAQIGAQPVGNYLTSIPSEYATQTFVNNKVAPYLLASTAASTYATIANLNSVNNSVSGLTNVVDSNRNYAEGRYARVCINTFDGTPKPGDILISL